MKLVPWVCKSCGLAHALKVDAKEPKCSRCGAELAPDDVPVDPAGEQAFDKLMKSKPS